MTFGPALTALLSKPCLACKHYQEAPTDRSDWGRLSKYHLCTAEPIRGHSVDYVLGIHALNPPVSCYTARQLDGKCKPEGLFFQPANQKEPTK